MNIGVIFAGGAGTRMNTKSRPKQFLELGGKPIIINANKKSGVNHDGFTPLFQDFA